MMVAKISLSRKVRGVRERALGVIKTGEFGVDVCIAR